jgi:Domain of unknown function (DUF4351)
MYRANAPSPIVSGQEEFIEGRAGLIIRLLTLRYGPLADDVCARISRILVNELNALDERLLTAPTAPGPSQVFGPTPGSNSRF